jgi:hypothetical protein
LNGGSGLLHPFVVDADISQISAERSGRCAKSCTSQRHQKDQANEGSQNVPETAPTK